jgi:hypothetical protein
MVETDFKVFAERAIGEVSRHAVVVANPYTRWFARGEVSRKEMIRFTHQFSVFSHLFIEAQLRKVINAPDLDSYRTGKEILLNELGVVFHSGKTDSGPDAILGTEGTIEGGRFHFGAAHFDWLLKFAEPLGLGFADLGKRRHGSPSTLFFCDELLRLYGSDDPSTASGASFAVEHWAAAGFWKELIAGIRAFRERECPALPMGFWNFHDRLEAQHAAHTDQELHDEWSKPGFDEGKFLAGAREMLDGVLSFWRGLDAGRHA